MGPSKLCELNRYEIGGWIAPNGDFYAVEYAGHNRMAEHIVHFILKPEPMPYFEAVWLSDRAGWIRLETDGQVHHDFKPTYRQVEVLYDIFAYALGYDYRGNLQALLEDIAREERVQADMVRVPAQGDQENGGW